MTEVSLSTSSWSSDVGATTFDCVIQCRVGRIIVNWDASAPSDTQDGFRMAEGDSLVLPAGSTFRVSKDNAVKRAVAWYAEFTV